MFHIEPSVINNQFFSLKQNLIDDMLHHVIMLNIFKQSAYMEEVQVIVLVN
jgi:hypothetical protein